MRKINKVLQYFSLPFLILGLVFSICLALVTEKYVHDRKDSEDKAVFDKTVSFIQLSLEQFEHPLQGANGLFAVKPNLSIKEFKKYSLARNNFINFQGALGIGFIRRLQSQELRKYVLDRKNEQPNFVVKHLEKNYGLFTSEYYIVEMVEPLERNKQAVGLLVSEEKRRYEAAYQAMTTGKPTLTRNIHLIQFANAEDPGFLFYMPVYKSGIVPSTVEDRLKECFGWIYAPIQANVLIEFATRRLNHGLRFKVYELNEEMQREELYSSEPPQKNENFNEKWQKHLDVGGREWIIVGDRKNPFLFLWLHVEVLLTFLIGLAVTFFISMLVKRKKIEGQIKDLAIRQARAEADQALVQIKYEKDFLQMVIDHLPLIISYWDQNMKHRLGNVHFSENLKQGLENYTGKNLVEIVGDRSTLYDLSKIQCALKGDAIEYEVENYLPNGILQNYLVKLLPHLSQGKVVGFFSIVVDISRVKSLERENQIANAKLVARSKMSMVGEMASAMAHEINNPLAIISGRVQLIGQQVENAKLASEDQVRLKNGVTTIKSAIMRISELLTGLRTFARDADGLAFERIPFSVVIGDVLSLCSNKLLAMGIDYKVVGNLNVVVNCNRVQLAQAFMSLFNNSIEAISNRNDRWILIAVSQVDTNLEIRFSDSGLGISPLIVDKIMQPFFTTKELGKGPGLGLSICKGIFEGHGGNFYYDVNAKNTTFVIELPVNARRHTFRSSVNADLI